MTVVAKTRQFQSCENLTKKIVANVESSKVVTVKFMFEQCVTLHCVHSSTTDLKGFSL
jgi:hypothetical protein